jgi:hypothetical protein
MPSLHYNPHVPGELARVILRRVGNRQVYVKPRMALPKPTEAMLGQRQVFTEACAYSTGVFRNPTRRAPFEAKAAATGTQVYATIMKEFLKNPVIRDVKLDGYHGHAGDVLVVQARTDLSLAVHVMLRRPDDTMVEEGDAVLTAGEYRYTATQVVPAGTALFADVTVSDPDDLSVKRSVPLTVTG